MKIDHGIMENEDCPIRKFSVALFIRQLTTPAENKSLSKSD